jgi:phosphonate transport system ATP-binding protein
VIRVVDLQKWFGRHHVLRGIDLEVPRGEVLVIIGPSGSGKSTLLKCLNFLEEYERGAVYFEDVLVGYRDVGGRRVRDHEANIARVRAQMGMVFQGFNLFPHKTVLENVIEGPLIVKGQDRRTATDLGTERLRKVGLEDKLHVYPSKLSGGQQQRAAIARAMVQGARVILADEPIASLDPESSRRVMDILARVNREDGCTVVVSLHQVNVAMRYCPRTVALHQGRIVYDGPSAALTPALLRELYGAEADEILALGDPITSLHEPRRPAPPAWAQPLPQAA